MFEKIKKYNPFADSFFTKSLSERRDMILHGNALSSLFYLSLPTILMSMVGAFVPIVDGIYLNQTSSSAVAAAVGISMSVINILNGLSNGLAVATKAILGQLNGMGNTKKLNEVSAMIVRFSFLLALLLMPEHLLGLIIYLMEQILK